MAPSVCPRTFDVEYRAMPTGTPSGTEPPTQQRQQLRTEQTNEIYLELGRFIVAWSQLGFWLRAALNGGYQGRGPGVNAIVAELNDRKLIEAFFNSSKKWLDHRLEHGVRLIRDDGREEVIREFNDEGDAELADTLRKWLHRLHDRRNRLLHDAWFVGWGNDQTDDWSAAELAHEKPGAEIVFGREEVTAEILRSLSAEVAEASAVVQLFSLRRRFGAERAGIQLVIDGKRLQRVQPEP